MRHLVLTIAVAAASAGAMAADVGVSVRVGQPNFYGRIDLGELPRPQVVYAQPIIVQPAPVGVVVQPIYLRVPPGHAKHWNKHCQRYNACGQPVYFVQEGWYNNVYAPRYRVAVEPAPMPPPAYVYHPQPEERVFVVPVTTVRAVVGGSQQRCWIERQQVVEERSDALNVPGAIAGAVIGGVLGHQVGGGHGKDIATVGGARQADPLWRALSRLSAQPQGLRSARTSGAAARASMTKTCSVARPSRPRADPSTGMSAIASAVSCIARSSARLRAPRLPSTRAASHASSGGLQRR